MRRRLTWKKQASDSQTQEPEKKNAEEVQKEAASGLYGHTKEIEKTVTASIRKIQKRAGKIATLLYKKNPKTAQFLATHNKRSKSLSAKILMAAMQELGPKFATTKEASHGMYGYNHKVAQLCLGGCSELKQFVGVVASDLHRRKAARYANITGFLKSHKKEAGCDCSNMLLSYYPDKDLKFASEPASVEDWIRWGEW